jgi:3-oxoacyl-[acyl-carrier protein] reductase
MDPLTGVGGCWQAERVKTMNSDLAGKVVLITGASGGLGSAMARAFAAEGTRLVLHYNSRRAEAEQLAGELGAVESLVAGADLRDEAQVRALFSQAGRRFGRVDTLVANAGVWSEKDVPIADMSLAQWQETLAADLTSVFLCCREFLQLARSQQQGNIVVIGSTAGVFGEPGHGDYAAAKSALAYGFTHTLKNEIARLAPHTASYCGGRVNCVCPGWTVSPMSEKHLQEHEMIRRVTATMALPQIARADDIANAVVYLASDRLARHVTGQTLVIAGGMEGRLLWSPEEIDPTIA